MKALKNENSNSVLINVYGIMYLLWYEHSFSIIFNFAFKKVIMLSNY